MYRGEISRAVSDRDRTSTSTVTQLDRKDDVQRIFRARTRLSVHELHEV